MTKSANKLVGVLAFALAALFIFSGFVKLIDPMGLQYKLDDYFKAFGLTSWQSASLFLSVLLSSTELVLGLCLLFRIAKRPVSLLVFVLMTFFSLLTLVLAITNPVSDCGCFGDAVKLTNWQTFFKNLIFWPIAWLVYSEWRNLKNPSKQKTHALWFLFLYALAVAVGIYSYHRLPMFDFMPYKKGVNLPAKLGTTLGVSFDEYKTVLYYKRWGKVRAFSPDSIPWQDTTWKFVDSKTELVKQGNAPEIDLVMIDPATGEDQLHRILEQEYALLIVAPYIGKADFDNCDMLNEIHRIFAANGGLVVALTGDTKQEIEAFKKKLSPEFECLSSDAVTLKTIIRAHPGYVLLRKGTIVAKWTAHSLPGPQEFLRNKHDFGALALMQDERASNVMEGLLAFALLLMIGFAVRLTLGRARRR